MLGHVLCRRLLTVLSPAPYRCRTSTATSAASGTPPHPCRTATQSLLALPRPVVSLAKLTLQRACMRRAVVRCASDGLMFAGRPTAQTSPRFTPVTSLALCRSGTSFTTPQADRRWGTCWTKVLTTTSPSLRGACLRHSVFLSLFFCSVFLCVSSPCLLMNFVFRCLVQV